MIAPDHDPAARNGADAAALARWLLGVALLIAAIVVVGGITRLTESGLSITSWKPVSGVLPPLTQAQWQAAFDGYKQIPQYTQVNGPAGMTLADYKFIFFWEWIHRLIARAVGLAFAVPLVWFWAKGRIPSGYKPRLLALLALGALQGVAGWWMVSSGLSQDVKVSHLRLAVHLLLALTTMGAIVWTALDLRALGRGADRARITGFAALAMAALALQLLFGALVAGLRAGHVASDWPLMQGTIFPQGIDWSGGPAHAVLYDPYLIHFIHRWWAWCVVAMLIVMGRRLRQIAARRVSVAIHAAFGIQLVLGIATVMSGVTVWIAVLHQLTGALLVAATVWGAHALGSRDREPVGAGRAALA